MLSSSPIPPLLVPSPTTIHYQLHPYTRYLLRSIYGSYDDWTHHGGGSFLQYRLGRPLCSSASPGSAYKRGLKQPLNSCYSSKLIGNHNSVAHSPFCPFSGDAPLPPVLSVPHSKNHRSPGNGHLLFPDMLPA